MTKIQIATAGIFTLLALGTAPAVADDGHGHDGRGDDHHRLSCPTAKLDAAAEKIEDKLECIAQAKARGVAPSSSCLARAEAAFSASFSRAGASCPGTTAGVESLVDACVASLADDVPASGRCAVGSLFILAESAESQLRCTVRQDDDDDGDDHEHHGSRGEGGEHHDGSPGDCLTRNARVLRARLRAAGGCASSDTQSDVDACRATIVNALGIGGATTTSTSTTSTSVTTSTSSTSTSNTAVSTTSTSSTSTTGPSVTTTSTSTTSSSTATSSTVASTTSSTSTTSTSLASTTSSTSTTSTSVASTTSSTSTTSTSVASTTSSTSTTSTTIQGCCAAERITLASAPGTLKVGGFAPFPFPAGVQTVIDAGTADATCKHAVTVPAGGFSVPSFCIPALQYTSQVTANGCESGTGDGAGFLWDGFASTHAGTPLTNVTKNADSADGVCDSVADICANRDNNLLGDIDEVITAGGDPTKVATLLDIPAHSRTWQDAAGCPGNGVYDPAEGDTLVTEFDFILSPTTGQATGAFVDKNADGCALPTGSAGFGAASAQCSAGSSGPCSATGAQASGPCCTVGQSTTTATVGEAFSNSFPLYDLGFINVIPNTVQSCGAFVGSTCTVTTDTCKF